MSSISTVRVCKRVTIVAFDKLGISARKIAKELGAGGGRGPRVTCALSRFIKEYKERRVVQWKKQVVDSDCKRKARRNRKITSGEIIGRFKIERGKDRCCDRTIRNFIKKTGGWWCLPRQKPLRLLKLNRVKRDGWIAAVEDKCYGARRIPVCFALSGARVRGVAIVTMISNPTIIDC